MIIESIRLTNWGPYKGENEHYLGSGIFAVIAEHEEDPERSNWSGKTWFLSAIKFALFGQRPSRVRTEDEWITHGELEGGVSITLSGGIEISRFRKKGSSTVLILNEAGFDATRKDAQSRIEEIIGMSKTDYSNGCCIEQKQTAKLVTATPAVLANIVSGWLDLEKLGMVYDLVKRKFNNCLFEIEMIQQRLNSNRSELEEIGNEKYLKSAKKGFEKKLIELSNQSEELSRIINSSMGWRKKVEEASKYEQIVCEGLKLKDELKEFDSESSKKIDVELETVSANLAVVSNEFNRKKSLLKGFDGTCPVLNKECKCKNYVTDNLEVTEDDVQIVLTKQNKLHIDQRKLILESKKIGTMIEKSSRLSDLRNRAIKLKDSVNYINENGFPPEETESASELAEILSRIREVKTEISTNDDLINNFTKVSRDILDDEEILSEHKSELAILREVMFIFGKDGAQKVISRRAVKVIEEGANSMLSSAGIDLNVNVRWSREGEALAKVCSDCGNAFPASRKVKVCSRCDAIRGRQIINELELLPTDSSGAADDLAGLAFQLSASAWLKAKTGSNWSVLCVDEPFAACDVANKTRLSNILHTAIKRKFAFEQAFVVAHDNNIMETMPRLIKITKNENGSTFKVF